MASNQELACIYAALALQDDQVPITAEKIQSIVKAAGIEIEPFWASLYAKALEGIDVKVLKNVIIVNLYEGSFAKCMPAYSMSSFFTY